MTVMHNCEFSKGGVVHPPFKEGRSWDDRSLKQKRLYHDAAGLRGFLGHVEDLSGALPGGLDRS